MKPMFKGLYFTLKDPNSKAMKLLPTWLTSKLIQRSSKTRLTQEQSHRNKPETTWFPGPQESPLASPTVLNSTILNSTIKLKVWSRSKTKLLYGSGQSGYYSLSMYLILVFNTSWLYPKVSPHTFFKFYSPLISKK